MSNFLIAIAMCYILFKIPFWILGSVRGGRRSLVGSLVRAAIAYKTYGLIKGGGAVRRPASGKPSSGMADPYVTPRSGPDGQLVLPLAGLKRARRRPPPHQRLAAPPRRPRSRPPGRQGTLFTPDGRPSREALPPALGPGAVRHAPNAGEQTMLPIPTRHEPGRTGRRSLRDDLGEPTTAVSGRSGHPSLFTRSGRVRPGAQPPKSGHPGALPTHVPPGGQYRLPLVGPFTQARPQPGRPNPQPSTPPTPTRVPGQLPLLRGDGEINPAARARRLRPKPPVVPGAYKGIRPNKDGQYSLPLNVPRSRYRNRPPATPEPEVHDPDQQQLPLNIPTKPQPERKTP